MKEEFNTGTTLASCSACGAASDTTPLAPLKVSHFMFPQKLTILICEKCFEVI